MDERGEVPEHAIHYVGGVEFAIWIPKCVWEASLNRLIDYDENLLFKLALL